MDLYSQLQAYERSQDQKLPTRGVVQGIDGHTVDVLVREGSAILRNVKVIGVASSIGQTVVLTWENGVPTAHITGEQASPANIVALTRGPAGPAGADGAPGAQGPQGPEGPAGSLSAASSVTLNHIATPSNPTAGSLKFYVKSDGKLYKLTSGGVELPVEGRELLYHQALAGTAGSINLYPPGNIPAGKHLHIKVLLRTNLNASSEGVLIKINNDANANYSIYTMWHGGVSPGTTWGAQTLHGVVPTNSFWANALTSPANEFGAYDLFVYAHTATNKNKNIQIRGSQRSTSGVWWFYDGTLSWHPATPAAITKIEFLPVGGGLFIAGCECTAWIEN